MIALRKQRLGVQQETKKLIAAQDWKKGLASAQKMLAIDQHVYAEEPGRMTESLATVALINEKLGDFATAIPLRQQVLEIRTKSLGADNTQVVSARIAVERSTAISKLGDADRKELAKADALTAQVLSLFPQQKFDEALPLAQQVVDIRQKLLGEKNVDYAMGVNNLASLLFATGEFVKSEPLFCSVIEIRKAALGEKHPDSISALDNLAENYYSLADAFQQQGDLVAAGKAWQQLFDTRVLQFGDSHWQTTDARLGKARIELQARSCTKAQNSASLPTKKPNPKTRAEPRHSSGPRSRSAAIGASADYS